MQNHLFCISRYTKTFAIEQRTSRNLLNTFPSVWKAKEVYTRRSLKQRNGRRRARRELDQSFKIGSNAVNGRERRSFLFFFFSFAIRYADARVKRGKRKDTEKAVSCIVGEACLDVSTVIHAGSNRRPRDTTSYFTADCLRLCAVRIATSTSDHSDDLSRGSSARGFWLTRSWDKNRRSLGGSCSLRITENRRFSEFCRVNRIVIAVSEDDRFWDVDDLQLFSTWHGSVVNCGLGFFSSRLWILDYTSFERKDVET